MRPGALLALTLTFFAGCEPRIEVGKRILYDPEYLCDVNGFDESTGCHLSHEAVAYESDCCGGTLELTTCGDGTTCHRPKADGVGICARAENVPQIKAVCVWPYEFPGD